MGISDRHVLVPYLWIRPISAWVRFGVKNQKKVDNAVVFGLRGMHNHPHLGHVMGLCVQPCAWALRKKLSIFRGINSRSGL